MEILTGNELTTGATVYLDGEGKWVDDLQSARVFGPEEAEARDAALAATRETQMIVGPEVEKVALAEGYIVPLRLRERIRATGPTAPVFDRQRLSGGRHVSI